MEIKDFHYPILFGILIFFFVIFLGRDEFIRRESLGEDVMGDIKKKWLNFGKKENFEDEKDEKDEKEDENFEDDEKEDEKPDTIEIDEKEDKKKTKKREGAANIGNIFKKIGKGIIKSIIGPMTKFFKVITRPILYIFGFVLCGFSKIVNIWVCAKWYVFNMILVILYFPYSMLFYLTGTKKIENTIWGSIYYVDSIFHDLTGYHFAHFPDDVVKLCYKCSVKF